MSQVNQQLLQQVERYCRSAGIAESTFGRQAVNDGKLCSRLRAGKSITLETPAMMHQELAEVAALLAAREAKKAARKSRHKK